MGKLIFIYSRRNVVGYTLSFRMLQRQIVLSSSESTGICGPVEWKEKIYCNLADYIYCTDSFNRK